MTVNLVSDLAYWRKGLEQYNPNREGCVLYLPLRANQLRGGSFRSIDKFQHLATVTGAIKISQGRDFDGVDDGISIPDAASLDIAGNITVMAWFKGGGTVARTVVSKGIQFASASNYTLAPYDNNRCFFEFYAGTVRYSIELTNAINATSWWHVGGVYDGTNQIIYRNGVADTTTNRGALTLDVDATALRIGRDDAYFFDGLVGEVWIYNRALSVLEIWNNYLLTKWRYQ